jgi:hypothetical protein
MIVFLCISLWKGSRRLVFPRTSYNVLLCTPRPCSVSLLTYRGRGVAADLSVQFPVFVFRQAYWMLKQCSGVVAAWGGMASVPWCVQSSSQFCPERGKYVAASCTSGTRLNLHTAVIIMKVIWQMKREEGSQTPSTEQFSSSCCRNAH